MIKTVVVFLLVYISLSVGYSRIADKFTGFELKINIKFGKPAPEIPPETLSYIMYHQMMHDNFDREFMTVSPSIKNYAFESSTVASQVDDINAWELDMEGIHSQNIYVNGWIPDNLIKILKENNFEIVSDASKAAFKISEEGGRKTNKSSYTQYFSPYLIITAVENEDVILAQGFPPIENSLDGSLAEGIIKINKYLNK
jgi:hypothetical protein